MLHERLVLRRESQPPAEQELVRGFRDNCLVCEETLLQKTKHLCIPQKLVRLLVSMVTITLWPYLDGSGTLSSFQSQHHSNSFSPICAGSKRIKIRAMFTGSQKLVW